MMAQTYNCRFLSSGGLQKLIWRLQRWKLIAATIMSYLLLGLPVYTQPVSENSRRFEVSVAPSTTGHYTYGGAMSFVARKSDWLGLVADVATYETRFDDLSFRFTTYQVGPRVYAREARRLRPFAHVLAGGIRHHAVASPVRPFFGSNDFLLTVGGGIDVQIRPWLALKAFEWDYQWEGLRRARSRLDFLGLNRLTVIWKAV
jgi:hypothetical protein